MEFRKTDPMWTQSEFAALDPEFKVPAVLSDGQWYTVGKIREYTRINEDGVVPPILQRLVREKRIIRHVNGQSYRMSLKQLEDWRRENGIALNAQLIGKILYPRIYGRGEHRYSEVEFFLTAPRHLMGICNFTLTDRRYLRMIREQLGYIGKFKDVDTDKGGPDRHQVWCLSSAHVREKLRAFEDRNGGPGTMFTSISSYNVAERRELNEFPQDALADLVEFYVPFAKVLVPTLPKTFATYIREPEDRDAKLAGWILKLVQKFDEQGTTPFAAYAQSVLPRWAYDMSSGMIGSDLNKFQLAKARAVSSLRRKDADDDSPIGGRMYEDEEVVAEMMAQGNDSYDLPKYREMNSQLMTWRQTQHAGKLQWDETGEEKLFHQPMNADEPIAERIDESGRKSRIQHAIIHAANVSGEYQDALMMLNALSTKENLAQVLMSGNAPKVTDRYRLALARAITGAEHADLVS